MTYNFVIYKKNEHIAEVIVNRPDKLNALNTAVLEELYEIFKEIEQDREVYAVILTGAGDKAFVAGADIKEMLSLTPIDGMEFTRRGQRLMSFIEHLHCPVIAAVNGYALGGGFELALSTDIIIASTNAKFGFPEVTLGIIPGFGGTQNLQRIVNPNIAKELIFTGKMITAEQAFNRGIINEVISEDLMGKAYSIANDIAKNGPIAVSLAKDAIINGANMAKCESLKYESALFGGLFSTEDKKEGMTAFVEKRKPVFKNR